MISKSGHTKANCNASVNIEVEGELRAGELAGVENSVVNFRLETGYAELNRARSVYGRVDLACGIVMVCWRNQTRVLQHDV